MKKFTILFGAVLIAAVSFGQKSFVLEKNHDDAQVKYSSDKGTRDMGTVIMTDDFSVPANWTIDNDAGNSDDWVIGTTGPSGSYAIPPIESTTAANGFALFDSDLMCSENQIGNLTTASSMDCSAYADVHIEFETFYRKFQDTIYLQVSNDGSTWTDFEVFSEFAVNDICGDNPTVVDMDISSVAGSQATVWVRFQFYSPNSGCDYAWMVDDVTVYEYLAPSNPDVEVLANLDGLYPVVPMSQTPSFNFGSTITNLGSEITNAFDVNIACVEDPTYTDAVAATVPMGNGVTEDIIFSPVFEPTAMGLYNIVVDAYPTGDSNPDNNTDTTYVIASDTVMAREDGSIIEGGLGFGAGSEGFMGQGFEINNNGTEMTSVTFYITTALNPLRVDVYDDNAGVPGTIVGTTGDYTVQESDTVGNPVYTPLTLPLQSAVELTGGEKYYLIVHEESAVDNIGLAYTENFFVIGESLVSFDGTTWGYSEDHGFNTTFVLRANINEAPVNTGTDFLTYSFDEQTGAATIDAGAHTIDIEVVNGTDLTSLIADFTLSTGATATVAGTPQE
ncbi:MAG: hypothetical protein U9Q98_06095, partial [Bacteroidota bacterium]|nr:hypothetical protein [Bacteroidota bacterium]